MTCQCGAVLPNNQTICGECRHASYDRLLTIESNDEKFERHVNEALRIYLEEG